ncbi:hypothetical protein HPB52_016480 [Rhipicephalus sanguineus]|uniref:SWIM-type domain-containing protein n=1 Tax=Rhipicephalus sanguineus TaxID=34632 RepID=A0A9D4TAU5_RHISA|nr:hypothetical protein HPB52_016480 [Rhipicephalus sanguineus]
MDATPARDRGTAGDGGERLDAPGPSRGEARDVDEGDRPANGSVHTAIRFVQINLDHARLASANLTDAMREGGITLALVSDPYRPGKKLPKPPPGFQYIAADNNPAAALLVARAPFDLCPLLVTPTIVAVYCEARDQDFTLISIYAPPHKPMEPILVSIEDAMRASRTRNIIVAGDFNAKHSAWGQKQTDARGSRVVPFAATHGLVVASVPDFLLQDALCTCKAGKGSRCKHIAAVVHYINSEENRSCTSGPRLWGKPSVLALGTYKKGSCLDGFLGKAVEDVVPLPPAVPPSQDATVVAELLDDAFHVEERETSSSKAEW